MQPNQQYQQYANPPEMQPDDPGLMQPRSAKKHHSWGLIMALTVFIVLTVVSMGFGVWAFAERQNYKDNSDKISAAAAAIAVQKEGTRKDNEFLEREKSPVKTYQGPDTYGSLNLSYPKTWSAYIVQIDKSAAPIDAYFHPNYVPGLNGGTAYALRVQVTSQTYSQELRQFEGKAKGGKVTVTPYKPKNVSGVTGSRIDGEIITGQKNSMILIPLRDRTIKISTESRDYLNDFDSVVLANLKFIP